MTLDAALESAPSLLWEETLAGGATWSHVLKRGTALRLTDAQGGANVGAMFFNFEEPVERYNMPDTLKAQHIARLTQGLVLYSDMGRVLCSMTSDTCGWHDPLGGYSTAASVRAQFGEATYQERRNDCYRNGHESFLIELAKHGLGPRDLLPPLNLFSKVTVGDEGAMQFVPGNSPAGSTVELRAEMNVLVVLASYPHPLDPATHYAPLPVELAVLRVLAPKADDPCRTSRPENERGFTLTERYFL